MFPTHQNFIFDEQAKFDNMLMLMEDHAKGQN